jgi:homogentisate 1,2-dioxygenase
MLDRLAFGELPAKHHLALYAGERRLRYEACLTREGFDGAYTISYHEHRPQALRAASEPFFVPLAGEPAHTSSPRELRRRHYRTPELARAGHSGSAAAPLLYSADLVLGCRQPAHEDATYHINADADELLFILSGHGTVRSPLGDLEFQSGDYVLLPKGLLYRLVSDPEESQHWLSLEFSNGFGIPAAFRNPLGQLRMDAPYCHRDFRRPRFVGPRDEGLREVWVKAGESRQKFVYGHSPLDVVGWDGTVYPWALPILSFQPRVSSVHLPPTWHRTFEARGALICSFVPRLLDFHPEAVPCPYPHLSAEMDEVLFYVDGDFSSRLGVARGSLTHHPAGVPHGPHPGRYEASIGTRRTEEVAVMLDCKTRLTPTAAALQLEDAGYELSFQGDG